MSRTILIAAVLFTPALAEAVKAVTDAEKKDFFKLLTKLPADWLEERDDSRGEFLRLVVSVTDLRPGNASIVPRLACLEGVIGCVQVMGIVFASLLFA